MCFQCVHTLHTSHTVSQRTSLEYATSLGSPAAGVGLTSEYNEPYTCSWKCNRACKSQSLSPTCMKLALKQCNQPC